MGTITSRHIGLFPILWVIASLACLSCSESASPADDAGGTAADGGRDIGTTDVATPEVDTAPPLAPALPAFVRQTTQVRPIDEFESSTTSFARQQEDRSYLILRTRDVVTVDTGGQVTSMVEHDAYLLSWALADGDHFWVGALVGDPAQKVIGTLDGDTLKNLEHLTVEDRRVSPLMVRDGSGALRTTGSIGDVPPSSYETLLVDATDKTKGIAMKPDGQLFAAQGSEFVYGGVEKLGGRYGPFLGPLDPATAEATTTHYRHATLDILGRMIGSGDSYIFYGQSMDFEDSANQHPVLLGFDASLELQWTRHWESLRSTDTGTALATSDGMIYATRLQEADDTLRVLLAHIGRDGQLLWARTYQTSGRVDNILATDDGGYLLTGYVYNGMRNPRDLWQMHVDADGLVEQGCLATAPLTLTPSAIALEENPLSVTIRPVTVARTSVPDVVGADTEPLTLYDRVHCGEGSGSWQDPGIGVGQSGCTCPKGSLCYSPDTGCDMGLVCVGHSTYSGTPVGHCSVACGTSSTCPVGTCHILSVNGKNLGGWCY